VQVAALCCLRVSRALALLTHDLSTTSSYLKENTIVSAEFNLYNTKDEKLVWSRGETVSVY